MMYRKTLLENGVGIISERLEHVKSVSIGIWVNTGSRDESSGEEGVSHFIEHMIFRGTGRRTGLEIAKELDEIGGHSNAFTGKETTCFYARVLEKDLERLADILCDIFIESRFDERDVERERQVIFQEIGMLEDTPEENIHVMFNYLFWSGHSMGLPILGTHEDVAAIERNTIKSYMRNFYVPERIIIAAAGNIDHGRLVSLFEPIFYKIQKGPDNHNRITPFPNKGFALHYKNLEQVHVCLGGEAPSLADEERFSCAVLNTILGGNMSSRLFQEIRENRGLAYSVFSFLSSYGDSGLLGVYAAVDPDKVNQVIDLITGEIKKIGSGDLSHRDLAAAKDYLIGSIYLASENGDNRMMRNARNEFLFKRYVSYDEIVDAISKVTIEDINETIHNVFIREPVSLVTLGPFKNEEFDERGLDCA